MNKGRLYGIGVGPGDPKLLTLAAVEAIGRCPMLAVPRTGGTHTLALDILRQAMDVTDKTILYLDFLMTTRPQALEERHHELADALVRPLESGRNVAMLSLGDPSIYSSFGYMARLVGERGYPIEIIPGVPSFCAAAAAAGMGLTEMGRPLHILPGGGAQLEDWLALPGSKVLLKSGARLPRVKEALRRAGLYRRAVLVRGCGLPGERVFPSLDETTDDEGYFASILIKE